MSIRVFGAIRVSEDRQVAHPTLGSDSNTRMGGASDEGRHVPGGAGAGEPGVVLRRPGGRCRVHPAVDAAGHRGPRAHPEDRCVRPRPDPPLDLRHPDRLVPHPAADAVHGQGHAVEGPGVVVVPVVARRLPGLQGHRRPGGAAALHRRARGRRAARAVPRGRAQVRSDGATALRRRRLRRPEGRRADRPGRHRWIGTGDAQGLAVHPPAQVPRHRRAGDHRTPVGERPRPARRSPRGHRRAARHAAAPVRRGSGATPTK